MAVHVQSVLSHSSAALAAEILPTTVFLYVLGASEVLVGIF